MPKAELSFRSVALLAAAAMMNGCATFDNRTGADHLDYSKTTATRAVVILSAGAAERCISFATRLRLLKSDSPYNGPMFANLPVDSYVVKSDFTDHQGFLHVVQLPAGSYYIAPYINNPALRMTHASRADFTVEAGEIVYLGEYFLTSACGFSGRAVFHDESARDFALVAEKNPALAKAAVKKRILAFTGEVNF